MALYYMRPYTVLLFQLKNNIYNILYTYILYIGILIPYTNIILLISLVLSLIFSVLFLARIFILVHRDTLPKGIRSCSVRLLL